MSDFSLYSEAILARGRVSVFDHTNASCLKCEAIKKHMVRVGSLHFCDACASTEFATVDPVRKERAVYKRWLETYQAYEENT